jgi:L-fuconolactonase
VGWVDLTDRNVEGALERPACEPLIKGVRHVLHDEPDENFMLRDDFLRGVRLLERYGLTYDILIVSRQLPQTRRFVEAAENQPLVLDHIGKPAIAEGEYESWKEGLGAIARHENVYCKLSGMVTEAARGAWSRSDFVPYMEAVLELFGAERVMYGSDWPVCTLEADYGEVIGIVRDYIGRLSQSEQRRIMGETAAEFYGLDVGVRGDADEG